jgi:hypothetical protein
MRTILLNILALSVASSLVAKEGAMQKSHETLLSVSEKGVGDFKVSKRLPASITGKDFLERYFCGYIGDGVPVEGLSLFDGQIRVYMKSGPFQRKALVEAVEPNCALFASRAHEDAKKGVKVSMISVLGAIAKTERGIGVGATLRELKEVYPNTMLLPVPPTMGADECVAISKSLPNVRFFFESCKKAEEGAGIVRIDVVTPQ